SDGLLENPQAASDITALVSRADYKYNAVFGRVNYNYDGRYLLNVTARRDGSARFGPENQFANFAAVGVGWILSEEKFMGSMPFVSFAKLRGSYGTTGNDKIGDYRFLDLYNPSYYPFMNTVGIFPTGLFNPQLAWELTKKLEGGIELGFFRDRLLLSASYFLNRSSNQLLEYRLPSITGFFSIPDNLPATVQNSGFELSLNTLNVSSPDFKWSTSINFTISRNKLHSFPGFETSGYDNTYVIGQPIGIIKAYRFAGVDPGTGRYQFYDSKGNSTFTPSFREDRTGLLNTAPRFYGGIQNSVSYKGFTLDFFFQVVEKRSLNPLLMSGFHPGFFNFNLPKEITNRWQQPGDIRPFQRYSQTFGEVFQSFDYVKNSDYNLTDGSFARLKNVSLSYQLPNRLKQKLSLQQARIYVQGQNIVTITDYIFDPESFTSVPPLRVLTVGLQITL
ncbi:MAG TPA: SusC/RagA family TonB-linked outer membrane protein, partial [Sphingobacteriaceae bacterium]